MLYLKRYLPNNKYRCWTVRKRKTKANAKGRKLFARCTTKEKANRQLRLLRAIQHNPAFREHLANTRKSRK